MSKINDILNEVKGRLIAAQTPAADRVYRRLEEPLSLSASPAIDIRYQGDSIRDPAGTPHPGMQGRVVTHELYFEVAALSRATDAEADALDLIAAVHAALLSDPTLGGLVAHLDSERCEAQSDDAESGACAITRQYRAIWRAPSNGL